MKHTLVLALLLVLPTLAQAKFRNLPPEHVLSAAEHVVVGTVAKLTSHTLTLTITDRVGAGSAKIPGSIVVQRRLPGRCRPMDPPGLAVGSRLIWCLTKGADAKGGELYTSWTGSPYRIRGGCVAGLARLFPRPDPAPVVIRGPRLKLSLEAIRGFRARVRVRSGAVHRLCSVKDLEAFAKTSPVADALIKRSGALKAPLFKAP